MSFDVDMMRRALALARRGQGHVHPNPLVGCVVTRGTKFVAEGWHRAFGKDHAEVEALRRAGSRARGAVLYVNLEPCAHWGKTPPCVEAIVRSGIRRVVAAMPDPNPRVAGKGFAFLRRHGIQITQGLLEKDASGLNRAFGVWVREHRPFVTLKAAMSLDGKMATHRGGSKWITGGVARARGHVMRAEADAVAVGIETVLKDNPLLTTHGHGRNPKRVIFDSRLRLPLSSKVTRHDAPTWVFTTLKASASKRRALERKGVAIYDIQQNSHGQVLLSEALRVLAREGVTHLLVEGGKTLLEGFLSARLTDEVVWFIAPKLIGGLARVARAPLLQDMRVEQIGPDLCVRGNLR